jgi:hypothetical protein
MPIEWETNKEIKGPKVQGHPKQCPIYPNHNTRKDGHCIRWPKCIKAGTLKCVAKGGT